MGQKMDPKNGSKMGQKWVKNGPKMTQIDPFLVPIIYRFLLKNDKNDKKHGI